MFSSTNPSSSDHLWPHSDGAPIRDRAARSVLSTARAELSRRLTMIGKWRRHRRDLNALYRLNDRMLADLGLTRGGIESAVLHGRKALPPAP